MRAQPDRIEKVVIPGGAGYVGTRLVPRLLREGYRVTVYDALFFGAEGLDLTHPRLELVEGDVRDTRRFAEACDDVDAVVHLAQVADGTRVVDPEDFEALVRVARLAGARRFILSSAFALPRPTGWLWGQADDDGRAPLGGLELDEARQCESLLLAHHDDDFTCTALRPAIPCGQAPRQRFDLIVNAMAHLAFVEGEVVVPRLPVSGPHLHVDDVCRAYQALLTAPVDAVGERVWDSEGEYFSMDEMARLVQSIVEREASDVECSDVQGQASETAGSAELDSDRLGQALGFVPEKSVAEAIRDLTRAFGEGAFPDSMHDDRYFNVRALKSLHGAGLARRDSSAA